MKQLSSLPAPENKLKLAYAEKVLKINAPYFEDNELIQRALEAMFYLTEENDALKAYYAVVKEMRSKYSSNSAVLDHALMGIEKPKVQLPLFRDAKDGIPGNMISLLKQSVGAVIDEREGVIVLFLVNNPAKGKIYKLDVDIHTVVDAIIQTNTSMPYVITSLAEEMVGDVEVKNKV